MSEWVACLVRNTTSTPIYEWPVSCLCRCEIWVPSAIVFMFRCCSEAIFTVANATGYIWRTCLSGSACISVVHSQSPFGSLTRFCHYYLHVPRLRYMRCINEHWILYRAHKATQSPPSAQHQLWWCIPFHSIIIIVVIIIGVRHSICMCAVSIGQRVRRWCVQTTATRLFHGTINAHRSAQSHTHTLTLWSNTMKWIYHDEHEHDP